jgi:DNA-binding MarR family transcriptional regulator
MTERLDSIDWSRRRWQEVEGSHPDHLAAMAAIFRLEQMVGSALDRALREHELTRNGYLILVTLRLKRDHTLTMSQLSKRLLLHPTTVSLATEKLQARGLLVRDAHPTDRRTILASLTAEGVRVLALTSDSLGGVQYGLEGVNERLAVTLTEIIRYVRQEMGDA